MMYSKRIHEGEILIDNNGSGGGLWEQATYTCKHCNKVVPIEPLRKTAAPYCGRCDRYICSDPKCSAECRPMEKWIEQQISALERNRRF